MENALDSKSLDTTWNDLKAAWSKGGRRLPPSPRDTIQTSSPKPSHAIVRGLDGVHPLHVVK